VNDIGLGVVGAGDNAENAIATVVATPSPASVSEDTQRERRELAYHEAGHAAMALLAGQKLGGVTIIPHGDLEGMIWGGGFGRCRLPIGARPKPGHHS
jgi:hypothetical protein